MSKNELACHYTDLELSFIRFLICQVNLSTNAQVGTISSTTHTRMTQASHLHHPPTRLLCATTFTRLAVHCACALPPAPPTRTRLLNLTQLAALSSPFVYKQGECYCRYQNSLVQLLCFETKVVISNTYESKKNYIFNRSLVFTIQTYINIRILSKKMSCIYQFSFVLTQYYLVN